MSVSTLDLRSEDICYKTIEKVSDANLMTEYRESPSVKKIKILSDILEKYLDNETIQKIIDEYATTNSDGKAIKKEAAKKDVKPPKAYKEKAKTKNKDCCGSGNSDDDYYSDYGDSGDCNSNSSNGSSDSESEEDETLQVLMSMTSGMLKDVRKGRTVY